ncbi:MAG: hypothetical protein IJY89_06605, partial [Clostridia bacterium]|nr:hypothetical protein [Clostridia bacterium]
MDHKQPNISENERVASFKKRPKKKLSTGQRIYRAIYTFFYVAAQLIRECVLFLYEKGKSIALATASFFRQTLASLKASKEPKDDKALLEKKREMPETQGARQSPMTREGDKKKAAPAKKHLSPFARKEKQYAEKDYLDFEEEPTGKRNKKKNKKKELPTFEEALLYEEEKKQRREALAKKAAVRFLSVALGLQL